ncbi:MAG: hypothetical protein HRJ53_13215, partial [Acidobacteria bacterium Pan2503]|nr:hypothetical protein [Candidatus Acidoferrum panamensis]
MREPTIAVGIAHASFLPERKASLERVIKQLGGSENPLICVSYSETREHARIWARRLWEWAATRQEDFVVLLNDDVDLCPDFLQVCRAMLSHMEGEIVSLHSQLPAARSIFAAGGRWLRSYWCSGPGYALPRGVAKRLLEWMDHTPSTLLDAYNEDGYVNMFAWGTRRPIWHCLPALVQHDTRVPSTLGYDGHPMRRAEIDWTSFEVRHLHSSNGWRLDESAPFVECPW